MAGPEAKREGVLFTSMSKQKQDKAEANKVDSPDTITIAATPCQVRELRAAMIRAKVQGRSELIMHLHVDVEAIEIVEGTMSVETAIALDRVE